MSNVTVKDFFAKDAVKSKFQELLGKKSVGFLTSVMQVATNNKLLANADPVSIYNSAAIAATLDLPINPNLGFAYIVPYGGQAQFQIGWKGLVQLALRTGQYKSINVIDVHENQFKSFDVLSEELHADFTKEGNGVVVGYVCYFKLVNGFEKKVYWSKSKVEKHAQKFSKTYSNKSGVWQMDFDAMARKTVLKNALSKWGILSIEMQTATIADQAVVNDFETLDVDYVDHGTESISTKQTLSNDDLVDVIEAVKNGNVTIESLQNDYDISEDQLKTIQYAQV